MQFIETARVRACRSRRVAAFDREEAKLRLYRGQGQGGFRLLGSGDWPANETWFDAAHDGETLFVTVMAPDAANLGLVLDGLKRDADVVEIFFSPFNDGLGLQQVIAGSDGTRAEGSHWPYRTAQAARYRDAAWDVELDEELQRPDLVRFYFFRFDLSALAAGPCLGFNVGRSQSRAAENATWNPVSGIGFNDPGCLGRLWLEPPPISCGAVRVHVEDGRLSGLTIQDVQSAEQGARVGACVVTPSGRCLTQWRPRAARPPSLTFRLRNAVELEEQGRYLVRLSSAGGAAVEPDTLFFDYAPSPRRFQLQGTYDWPDNFGNVAYSPASLADEMLWYADCGLERFYWLDYPVEMWLTRRGSRPNHWGDNIQKSRDLFGQDFLPGAVGAAHAAGAELVTIFKPFDLAERDPFLVAHPEFLARRNPAWTAPSRAPIAGIRLYQCDERPFPFAPDGLRLHQSRDNRVWRQVRKPFRASEAVVRRPRFVHSPAGLVAQDPALCSAVRCITLEGLDLRAPFLAVTARQCDPAHALRNRRHLLVELVDAEGRAIPATLDVRPALPGEEGFAFGPMLMNRANWSRTDSGADDLVVHRGESLALGMSLQQPLHMPRILEPSFPEVREFWLDRLRRGLDAGADAVSIRIAHHVGCIDWLSYMYAEPVLEQFRARAGRDPQPCNGDYALIRRIRGEAYTEFVRAAAAMARAAGKRFQHHVENRMLAPPECDCYTQIHWDWETWLREGLVDEIDLKYIGPDHPDCYTRILPLARQCGVRVNWISADPEPRSRPRSIGEAPRLVDRARAAGLDGINLYELWLYHRMTDRGTLMTRGCGEAIIREMRARVDEGRCGSF